MGVIASIALLNTKPIPVLIIVFDDLISSICPFCPFRSPDLHTTLSDEHSVANVVWVGAIISFLFEDENIVHILSLIHI